MPDTVFGPEFFGPGDYTDAQLRQMVLDALRSSPHFHTASVQVEGPSIHCYLVTGQRVIVQILDSVARWKPNPGGSR